MIPAAMVAVRIASWRDRRRRVHVRRSIVAVAIGRPITLVIVVAVLNTMTPFGEREQAGGKQAT
jgi:hypothetical protein